MTATAPFRPPAASSTHRRIALVANRFGPGVAGGAEAVLADVGRGLRDRGWEVHVVTTCARDLYTWANELPEGDSEEWGLAVHRFATVVERDQRQRNWIGHKIGLGWATSLDEQYHWMNTGVRAPRLFDWLLDNSASFQAVVLAPYMFWTTFAGAEAAGDRAVLHPCLHDEPPAYLEIFKPMFQGVRGILYQTEPEMELGRKIFGLPERWAMVGSGVHVPDSYDPEGFRRRHQIEGDFVLYAGRREWGKGWTDLLRDLAFANQHLGRAVPLITFGAGELGDVPPGLTVRNLGFLSDADRDNAMAAATVYVQPSPWESFSRTIMEAWLAGTPVLANGRSAVVSWHCERSRGGLVYRDRYEFTEALRVLLSDAELRQTLAHRGRQYVLDNYQWAQVLDCYEAALDAWAP